MFTTFTKFDKQMSRFSYQNSEKVAPFFRLINLISNLIF